MRSFGVFFRYFYDRYLRGQNFSPTPHHFGRLSQTFVQNNKRIRPAGNVLPGSTYEARSLERRSGGAQHAQAHLIVDDPRTLEVGQHLHRELLERGARVAERERRDAPSKHRALLTHVRGACKTRGFSGVIKWRLYPLGNFVEGATALF